MASISANRSPAQGLGARPDSTSTHPYTCNTCQVAFRNGDSQRGHMRGDWHRYNLKRRVAALPPITAEVFSEKVLQAQATSTAAASKATFERSCRVCEKTYYSENAYQNHINSSKHKIRESIVGTINSQTGDDEASSVMSSTFSLGESLPVSSSAAGAVGVAGTDALDNIATSMKNATIHEHRSRSSTISSSGSKAHGTAAEDKAPKIALTRCLFCNYDSPSLSCNAVHMERIHGMFIPEKQYLVDMGGLIKHLQRKVHYYHECLSCGKLKPSVFGLQTHMRDTGHCRIPFDSEEEQLDIGDFYDFRSTYSDVDDEEQPDEDNIDQQRPGRKLGAPRHATDDNGKDSTMDDADGWETDSSESSLDSANLTAVPLDLRKHQYEKLNQHPHHAHTDPRPHHNKDGWHSHAHKHIHAAYYSEYELHLPSGRVAGHRSLNRYFRQNLHNHPSAQERHQRTLEAAEHTDSDSDDDSHEHSSRDAPRGRALVTRAEGGLGMIGVTTEKKQEVRQAEKRARKLEQREMRRFQWGNNKQSNSQKHFRDPLLQ